MIFALDSFNEINKHFAWIIQTLLDGSTVSQEAVYTMMTQSEELLVVLRQRSEVNDSYFMAWFKDNSPVM